MLFIVNISKKTNKVVVNGRMVEYVSKEEFLIDMRNKWGKNYLVDVTEM